MKYQTISLQWSFQITCYCHMWRYHVFLRKLTWYCICVYIITDRIQSNIVFAERRHPLGNSYCKGSRLEWSHGSCKKNFCGKEKNLNQNTVEHGLWLQCFHDNIVITIKCLWPLHWRCGCPVQFVQFVNISNNASLFMIPSIIRPHDGRFFSKNWFNELKSPVSLALFISVSLKTFCLTARTYLNTQKYGLFCSLQD